MPSPKPRYVYRWNVDGALQPFEITGARMYIFVFKSGDSAALQDLCDRYLNAPLGAQRRFTPFMGLVFFAFTSIQWVTSQTSPFRDWGGSTELELAVWVPVIDSNTSLPSVRWFSPYMFVDSSMATWQGREIYGLPKEAGYFEPDFSGRPSEPPHEFSVSGLAVTRFGSIARPSMSSLVRISRPPNATAPKSRTWSSFDEAAEEAGQLILGKDHVGPIKLLPPQGMLLSLKQFPDETDGHFAAYQRVLGIPCVIHPTGFEPGGSLPGYKLCLTPAHSHPISDDTGLPGNGESAMFGWWLGCGFTMGNAVPV